MTVKQARWTVHSTKVRFCSSRRIRMKSTSSMVAKVPANDATARLGVAVVHVQRNARTGVAEAYRSSEPQPNSTPAADMIRSLEASLRQFPPGGAPKMTTPEPPAVSTELRETSTPPAPPSAPKKLGEPVPVPVQATPLGRRTGSGYAINWLASAYCADE